MLKKIKNALTKENIKGALKAFRHMPGSVYIVLIVVFTAVLVADLLNFALTPASGNRSRDFSDFSQTAADSGMAMSDDAKMPDFDSMEMPSGDASASGDSAQSGNSDSSGSSMPPGGAMPDGSNADSDEAAAVGEDSADSDEVAAADDDSADSDDTATADGGFSDGKDFAMTMDGNMPSAAGTASSSGFRSAARRFWLLILIVCLIGDLVSVLLFRRVCKKVKAENQALEGPTEDVPVLTAEERKRRNRKFWAIPVCIVLIITIVIASLPTGSSTGSTVTVDEEVLEGTVESDTIDSKLVGAGTLEEEDAVVVSIPDVVTVTAYYVENGDTVSEGDVLASVDTTSVSAAIVELQEVIDELDEELEEEAEETATDTITAAASGCVKKIYAEEGDAVSDVIYDNGALMLISLDGLMVVQFTSDEDLTTGDSVIVELSDGTQEDGRVASVSEGVVTVTLSDETAAYGESVTVYDEDGNELGSGELAIHSELKVTGYYGTISDIEISLDEEVDVGDTLIELEDTGHTATYTALLNRRYELEDQMAELFTLYTEGYIYAESDGVVSGISDDAVIAEMSAAGSASTGLDDMAQVTAGAASAGDGAVLVLLSNEPEDAYEDSDTLVNYVSKVAAISDNTITIEYSNDPVSIDDYSNLADYSSISMDVSGSYTYSSETIYTYDDENSRWVTCEFSDIQVGDLIIWTFDSSDSGTDSPLWLILVSSDDSSGSGTGTETDETETERETETETKSETETEIESETETGSESNTENAGEGENPSGVTGDENAKGAGESENGDNTGDSENALSGMDSLMSGSADSGTTSGTDASAAAGASGTAEAAEAETYAYETYSVDEKDVLSITPQDEMTIEITVDELDILSLEVGLEAEIVLDAVQGQSFTGTVSHISTSGSNDGGNTKYAVTVSFERTDQMLAGMNASVTIITDSTDAEVTVPAEALVEDGGKTYVYTSYDEKTDTLGDLVEVETGASDGFVVEIVSGLSSEDSYYYRYADSVVYNFLAGVLN